MSTRTQPRGAFVPPAFPFPGFDAESAAPLFQPPRYLTEMVTALGNETLRFTGKRLRAQAEFLDALSSCRSVEDVVARQTEFFQRAGSDYAEELGSIMRLAGEPKPAGNAD